MAPQLMATNGAFLRRLLPWTARATSSLPVPLSPWTSTVTSVLATSDTMLKISRIRGVLPMISSKRALASASAVC